MMMSSLNFVQLQWGQDFTVLRQNDPHSPLYFAGVNVWQRKRCYPAASGSGLAPRQSLYRSLMRSGFQDTSLQITARKMTTLREF